MARRRDREINIFNIAFLDVITGAMGAFVLMVLLLAPYYTGDVKTSPHIDDAQKDIGKARDDIAKAEAAGADPAQAQAVQQALAEAAAALAAAADEIAALKNQLNQLEAQNARLKQLDDDEQKQIADLQAHLDADNKQIADLRKAVDAQGGKPVPLDIVATWPCADVNADVYALSDYAAEGGQKADPGFDPMRTPAGSAADVDKVGYIPWAPPYSRFYSQVDASARWNMADARLHKSLRIYAVLRDPLSVPDAAFFLTRCNMLVQVFLPDAERYSAAVMPSATYPVAYLATYDQQDDGSFTGRSRKADQPLGPLTDAEQAAVTAWKAQTADRRDPVAALKAGRIWPGIAAALRTRAVWDRRALAVAAAYPADADAADVDWVTADLASVVAAMAALPEVSPASGAR